MSAQTLRPPGPAWSLPPMQHPHPQFHVPQYVFELVRHTIAFLSALLVQHVPAAQMNALYLPPGAVGWPSPSPVPSSPPTTATPRQTIRILGPMYTPNRLPPKHYHPSKQSPRLASSRTVSAPAHSLPNVWLAGKPKALFTSPTSAHSTTPPPSIVPHPVHTVTPPTLPVTPSTTTAPRTSPRSQHIVSAAGDPSLLSTQCKVGELKALVPSPPSPPSAPPSLSVLLLPSTAPPSTAAGSTNPMTQWIIPHPNRKQKRAALFSSDAKRSKPHPTSSESKGTAPPPVSTPPASANAAPPTPAPSAAPRTMPPAIVTTRPPLLPPPAPSVPPDPTPPDSPSPWAWANCKMIVESNRDEGQPPRLRCDLCPDGTPPFRTFTEMHAHYPRDHDCLFWFPEAQDWLDETFSEELLEEQDKREAADKKG